ncbi:MAG: hypothetical protein KJN94_01015, partial [Gammaproteobacteria bacterium]|nr:hypothetical protein [Gammaproteobacteria bacterium]
MNDFLNRNARHRQKGAITMFTAVLILILLTELVIFATQVGVFEQRKSANEMNQKIAFHTADGALQMAKQFMTANAYRASSSSLANGWLATGATRWQPCVGNEAKDHPCWAEPVAAFRDGDGTSGSGSYFYSFDGSNELPLDPGALGASTTENVTLHALLCMLEIDRTQDPIVRGCTTDTSKHDQRYFMITLLARGEADCTNSANCNAEALVSTKIGSFGPGGGAGGPGVPLTARTAVPLSGTVEIATNPNGGGVGVPISSWVNANNGSACDVAGDPIDPVSGSYSTCERHEWYGVDEFPADYKCPTQNCACLKSDDRLLSYADGNERILSMDIVPDDSFPCDLFQYMFGIPKSNYQAVIDLVPPQNRLTDCDSLDTDSVGLYWISGSECDFKTQVGTAENPVFLISAAGNTKVSAGASMFGVLMVTDAEVSNADFTGNGHATI